MKLATKLWKFIREKLKILDLEFFSPFLTNYSRIFSQNNEKEME